MINVQNFPDVLIFIIFPYRFTTISFNKEKFTLIYSYHLYCDLCFPFYFLAFSPVCIIFVVDATQNG